MTAPAETPDSQDPTALVQAIKARAVELGIAWELVTGTMATTTTAVVDGDTVAVPVISLAGAVGADTRVGLLRVPPSGLYVLGVAANTAQPNVVARGSAANTVLQALAVTPAALTSASVTLTAVGDVYWEAIGVYDLEATVAAAAVGQGYLYVDTVAETKQALLGLAVVTRATVTQMWSGTLSAGTHTFEMYAGKSANVGTSRCNATHTNLRVTFYA